MPFPAADAAIFVRDGKLASTAVGAAKVHLDFPEEVEQFSSLSKPGQVAGFPRMTYITAELPGLVFGAAVEIEGVSYKVKWTRQLDDGTFSQAELQKG